MQLQTSITDRKIIEIKNRVHVKKQHDCNVYIFKNQIENECNRKFFFLLSYA
jgi:hypothetical protein